MVGLPRRLGDASLALRARRDRSRRLRYTVSPGFVGIVKAILALAQAPSQSLVAASLFGLWRGRLFWPVAAGWHFRAARSVLPRRPAQAPTSGARAIG
jgi:hypothetical protein